MSNLAAAPAGKALETASFLDVWETCNWFAGGSQDGDLKWATPEEGGGCFD